MTFQKFAPEDVAMLLIDHQVGTMSWVHSIPQDAMKSNALLLAKIARLYEIPVVLTASMEDHAQGPLMPELEEILPDAFAARVRRAGIVNAMEDEGFAAAVRATGRRKLVIAGVTNDVCTVYPALTLVDQGFEVQVVADAGGSPSPTADDMALRRMEKAGATLTSTNQLVAELVGSWGTAKGGQAIKVMMEAMG